MIDWYEQPRDVANLYNPAFIGETVRRAAHAYKVQGKRGMPMHLAFILTPLVLYTDSRSTVKAASHSYLHSWITAHPELRISLARRIIEITPYTRLGVAFSIKHASLALAGDGTLVVKPRRRVKDQPDLDTLDYFVAARTLGRWFARVDQDFNIYLMLGIRP